MDIRPFELKDYKEIMEWWKTQDWTPLPAEFLGPNGFVAEDNNKRLAATWIYRLQDSPWAIMEWTVGNPSVAWETRSKAIKLVTDKACEWAKEDGAQLVFTMTKNKRFLEKLEEYGFKKTDSDMIHLIRSL